MGPLYLLCNTAVIFEGFQGPLIERCLETVVRPIIVHSPNAGLHSAHIQLDFLGSTNFDSLKFSPNAEKGNN